MLNISVNIEIMCFVIVYGYWMTVFKFEYLFRAKKNKCFN